MLDFGRFFPEPDQSLTQRFPCSESNDHNSGKNATKQRQLPLLRRDFPSNIPVMSKSRPGRLTMVRAARRCPKQPPV
jgi:hypothetical protein